ncbi:MAG: hypothetical protein [Podoviridae sp. ctbh1]|nr:MAG: hypothetical protein [Podoviridae sp. ctbh1]
MMVLMSTLYPISIQAVISHHMAILQKKPILQIMISKRFIKIGLLRKLSIVQYWICFVQVGISMAWRMAKYLRSVMKLNACD